MEVVDIKKVLAPNLLIYIYLHCVRSLSWCATTLATLVLIHITHKSPSWPLGLHGSNGVKNLMLNSIPFWKILLRTSDQIVQKKCSELHVGNSRWGFFEKIPQKSVDWQQMMWQVHYCSFNTWTGFLKVSTSQKQFFLKLHCPKINLNFWQISALAFKMGQIKKIKAHYYS